MFAEEQGRPQEEAAATTASVFRHQCFLGEQNAVHVTSLEQRLCTTKLRAHPQLLPPPLEAQAADPAVSAPTLTLSNSSMDPDP